MVLGTYLSIYWIGVGTQCLEISPRLCPYASEKSNNGNNICVWFHSVLNSKNS